MLMDIFKPSPRYLTRLRVVISLWAVGLLLLGILLAWLVSLNFENMGQATRIVQIVLFADLLWYVPAMLLIQSAYKTRLYKFDQDEITIHSGWWTESIRHIPLSSVVAFESRWDKLDRWLEIGTLEVYIVSRHHVNGLRVHMAGLADVEMVAQLANRVLKRMRERRMVDFAYLGNFSKSGMLSDHQ
jgi:membrane protein YdbS with pleckstrin-like domain